MWIQLRWLYHVFIATIAIIGLGTEGVWCASSQGLNPRVPPEQLEEAKTLENPFPVTKEFVEKGKILHLLHMEIL